LPVFIG